MKEYLADWAILAVVDLPGLIHSANKQQTEADVSLINDLVNEYISKQRTIILAVITAKNDPANQIILKLAREADKDNERTLGILTKPDTLEEGTKNQETFVSLVNNEDIILGLGWHTLRNRAHGEEEYSPTERNEAEATFLAKGAWRSLRGDRKGITTLRTKLSELLFHQIKRHLPAVRSELNKKLENVQVDIAKLGMGRSTLVQQKQYWFNLVKDYRDCMKQAVQGHYGSDFFVGSGVGESTAKSRRLRALLMNQYINFGNQIRLRGRKYTEHGRSPDSEEESFEMPMAALSSDTNSSTTTEDEEVSCYEAGGELDPIPMHSIPKQKVITQADMQKWVRRVLLRSRGCELPGLFQPLLVGELLWEQTSRWEYFARAQITASQSLCLDLVDDILEQLVPGDGTCSSLL